MKKIGQILAFLLLVFGIVGCSNKSLDFDEMKRDIKKNGFKVELQDRMEDKDWSDIADSKDIDSWYNISFTKGNILEDDYLTLHIDFEDGDAKGTFISVGSDWHKQKYHHYNYEKDDFKKVTAYDGTVSDMGLLDDAFDEIGYSKEDVLSFCKWYIDKYK